MARVLVVDDSIEICAVIRLTLSVEGYDVDTVHDAESALEVIDERVPDLILMDIALPGDDGLHAALKIHRKYGEETIPIIFISAKAQESDIVQGLEIGVDYISKPFTMLEMLARVKRALRTHLVVREKAEVSETSLKEDSLVVPFDFPAPIRSACEEYLWSFVQFLQDVGVDATAELKHEGEAGQVLFSVTPTKGKEALGKIKQALELYLGIASATSFGSESDLSIQVERLQGRVLFFQSQLRMAQAEAKAQLAEAKAQLAEAESQKATIKVQETTIALMAQSVAVSQFNAATVFEMAQKGTIGKPATPEDVKLFEGLIKLKEMEFRPFGVSVSWPKLIEWTKRWMADEESTSDLPTYLKTKAAQEFGEPLPGLPPEKQKNQLSGS